MGDSGEGLIDNDERIQERMDEAARERRQQASVDVRDPEKVRALESLRLARMELERQLKGTVNEHRRAQLQQAIAEVDRRAADLRESP